ncbi:MAG TPA: hypothetical protein VEH06_02880 [Candidatus Bathyarchaeia archaeon]|nr:hypothetical protein [Candidatus Bathyarchaeia archaeon]
MDLTRAMKRCIRNDSNGEVIDKLNLPDGLKELLAGHGFNINQLSCMKSGYIADILGIDQDAARLIVSAVRKSAAAVDDFHDRSTTGIVDSLYRTIS